MIVPRPLLIALVLAGLSAPSAQAAAIVVAPATPEPAPVATADPVTPPAASAASSLVITLGTTGDFERKTVAYGCEGDVATLSVDYLNAAPNYLALLPIDGSTLVFNTVLSASGARYAAGKYIWTTKGKDGALYDLTLGDNAKPVVTCSEVDETP